MDTKMLAQLNAERFAECQASMERMGLAIFFPMFREKTESFPERGIICDPQGKAIVCTHKWSLHVATVMSDLLDREIESKTLIAEDQKIDVYYSAITLSVPERHSLATMNSYFGEYRPGFHAKDGNINFPSALSALHFLAAPANFVDEVDAYQLANAINEIFMETADIVATDEGYAVVVHDEHGDLNGWISERIAAIADVVSHFNLTPKWKKCLEIKGGPEEGYSSAAWQIQIGKRYTQQQRIEDGINAILARLDHPITANINIPASGSSVASALANQSTSDRHTSPSKTKRKSTKS